MPAGADGPRGVVRVVDGDTVVVAPDTTVRLIGIDTPETVDPRKPVQCFGREASAYAHLLLDGHFVWLEYDPTQGRLDKYGRTLAYVWMPDGRLFNEVMIADGYAHEYTYDLPYRYQDTFIAAERTARESERGLWSPTTCNGDTASATTTLPTAGSVRPGCDSSYPTVCIPPPSPDLDCADIPYRGFAVVGADPHRFDSDHDGTGCES
jgi:micrococcal nuclease